MKKSSHLADVSFLPRRRITFNYCQEWGQHGGCIDGDIQFVSVSEVAVTLHVICLDIVCKITPLCKIGGNVNWVPVMSCAAVQKNDSWNSRAMISSLVAVQLKQFIPPALSSCLLHYIGIMSVSWVVNWANWFSWEIVHQKRMALKESHVCGDKCIFKAQNQSKTLRVLVLQYSLSI